MLEQSLGGAFDAGPELGYVRWRADGSPERPPWPPECRPGGALDERLPDAPWLASIRP